MNTGSAPIESRPPNWLPLPFDADAPAEDVGGEADVSDLFTKARVVQWYPRQGRGLVVTDRGKSLPFDLSQVRFVGPKGARGLSRDKRVGIDVAWTSKGLHVQAMKVY